MRIVLIGTGSLAIATARLLVEHGHELVIVEPEEEKVEKLGQELDCGFVVGDGTRPAVLKEIGPKNTEILFCLADDDHDNIIAALVGRSLGFGRVVTSLKDTDFEPICAELGLGDIVFVDRAVARNLSDMVEGIETAGLTAAVRGGLRFYSFRIAEDVAGALSEIALPEQARVIVVTRGGKSQIARDDVVLKGGDEILVVAETREIDRLRDLFLPHEREPGEGAKKE